MCFSNDLNHVIFGLSDGALDCLVCLLISNRIPNADAVAFDEEEVVDHGLNGVVEVACCIWALRRVDSERRRRGYSNRER